MAARPKSEGEPWPDSDSETSCDDEDDDFYWCLAMIGEESMADGKAARTVKRRRRDVNKLPDPMLSPWGMLLKNE